MSQPDPPPPAASPDRSYGYPNDRSAATPSLADRIADRIRSDGPLGFPEFMEMALYDRDAGYYAATSSQVGRGGDFFTSVSVGPLFGRLLARVFLRHWLDSGSPARWRITECGAHRGDLAADVLEELGRIAPDAFAALEYLVLEPLPTLQACQQENLAGFTPHVRWESSAAACEPLPGVVFGNELLDALPFHTVAFHDGRWLERAVDLAPEGGFTWRLREISDAPLKEALQAVGDRFPDGYETEIRTCLRGFLTPLVQLLDGGLMLWFDYGFPREDLYHPARTTGTLRTFARHRAGEDPLAEPGSRDITAHVDFTAVAETVRTLGGDVTPLRHQGGWLTGQARDWLLAQEGRPDPELLRQFQTLTHPGHLGRSFLVFEGRFD